MRRLDPQTVSFFHIHSRFRNALRRCRSTGPDDTTLASTIGHSYPVVVLQQRNEILPRNPHKSSKFRRPIFLARPHPRPDRLAHPPQRLNRIEAIGLALSYHPPTI